MIYNKETLGPCLLAEGTFYPGDDGYAREWFEGKLWKRHRLEWVRKYGPIPKGMCVCHKCDVRNCINTDHMFLGTKYDNHKDMVEKGRRASFAGERNGQSKLTEDQVRSIRSDPRPMGLIAFEYDMSYTQIKRIKNGSGWRSVK